MTPINSIIALVFAAVLNKEIISFRSPGYNHSLPNCFRGGCMRYDFDRIIDRRNSDSSKWNYYPEDVLPLWTADMDFAVPQPVLEALHSRVDHGVFGYAMEPAELREILAARLARLYGWQVQSAHIVFLAGVVLGFNRFCRATAAPGDAVLVQPPVYPPIFAAPEKNRLVRQEAVLVRDAAGKYGIDFDAFQSAITDRTRAFILCNPHNPVGRAFRRNELERMAEICLRNNVLICSDEIHCDILFRGTQHIPIASLSPEVARRTVTLMAPSKTYNIPGLHCSMAITSDPALRRKLREAEPPFFPEGNLLGFVAAVAAYRDGGEWLDQVLAYLETNRNLVAGFVAREMPEFKACCPEATYLTWLDCRNTPISADPYRFFLEKARVALSNGKPFGTGGEGFVRLNFACPRSTLVEALGRMKSALSCA
jgi:cystathionine beta-lyase